MSLSPDVLKKSFDAGVTPLERDRARAYAAATNDTNPLYERTDLVPPGLGVVATWKAMQLAVDNVLPPAAASHMVHAERDMHFHQPLRAGMRLHSSSQAYSWRSGKNNSVRYTLRILSQDDQGKPVLEQFVTMFVPNLPDAGDQGPDKPNHDVTEGVRAKALGKDAVNADADQTFRYRDASGDLMPIHVDAEAAKKIGLPGIILHGICTMAMTGNSVLKVAGPDSLEKLKRLAVRWSKPVFPGTDLTTQVFDGGVVNGRRVLSYETTSKGVTVVTNGRVELASP